MRLKPLGWAVIGAAIGIPVWLWLDDRVMRVLDALAISPVDAMILIALSFVTLLVAACGAHPRLKGRQ